MPKIILFLLLIFISVNLKAQTWELGASAGGAGYMGDLNANNPLKVSGISVGGFVQRNFDGYLSAKINYTYGSISGNDANSGDAQMRARGLNFTTSLNEVAAIGEFNFLNYIPEAGKNKFTPYIYLGFAYLINYTPNATYNGQTYNLLDYKNIEEGTQASPKAAYSIPFGAGIKYNISGKWTLAADIGYRKPNTDYLDGVSGFYPKNPSSLTATERELSDPTGLATPGSQRGDLNGRDTYFFTQISLSFTFVTQKCYFER